MIHYFLNIGSNLGHRKLNISRALRALEGKYGYFEASKLIESKPWGFESEHEFVNIGVMILSDRNPLEVLADIKEIEKSLNPLPHRHADGSYADRVIDIDIMAADEMIIDTPELKVPHPHLEERMFFLQPLAELAPSWKHPVSGKTPAETINELKTLEKKKHP